jgi:hypothetical protein
MDKYLWLVFVAIAGLSWGTYVPIIFYGGTELSTKPGTIGGRLASILCVGCAYFVLAVLIPLALMATREDAKPQWATNGLIFSGLAGVAGAVGAICVIFASKAAVDAAKLEGINPATYRIYIAPLIFALAPTINTIVSLFWHPKAGDPFHFGLEHMPGIKLLMGIALVAVGSFLVLLSKEEAEAGASKGKAPAPVVPAAATAGEPGSAK